MPRSAALLCIHNEAHRLGWWIAHHIAAGFTALLICDDHSTDGSRELLSQAARNYDIRLLETDPAEKDTLQRQQDGLAKLLQQEGGHFNWVIQLAVDEYFLPAGGSVSAFFTDKEARMGAEAFLQAQHIPVNWCITGLGGLTHQRLDGQTPHPRALFTTHASEDFPDHRVTRDFFRPGDHPALPDPFAHIQTPPDWSSGRILHDAAASSRTPQARRHFDRNDVLFPAGRALLPQTLAISAHIIQGLILSASYAIQNRQSDSRPFSGGPAGLVPRFRRFHLFQGDDILVLDRDSQSIKALPEDQLHATESCTVLCLVQSDKPVNGQDFHPGWLYSEQPSSLAYLPALAESHTLFASLLDCLPLHIGRKGDTVTLRIRPAGLPFPAESSTPLTTREAPPASGKDPIMEGLRHFTAHGFSAAGLEEAIRRSRWLSPSIIGSLYALLPPEEASTILTPLLYRFFHGWKS